MPAFLPRSAQTVLPVSAGSRAASSSLPLWHLMAEPSSESLGTADQTESISRQPTCPGHGHEPTARVSLPAGDTRVCVTVTRALVKRDILGSHCQSF